MSVTTSHTQSTPATRITEKVTFLVGSGGGAPAVSL